MPTAHADMVRDAAQFLFEVFPTWKTLSLLIGTPHDLTNPKQKQDSDRIVSALCVMADLIGRPREPLVEAYTGTQARGTQADGDRDALISAYTVAVGLYGNWKEQLQGIEGLPAKPPAQGGA